MLDDIQAKLGQKVINMIEEPILQCFDDN